MIKHFNIALDCAVNKFSGKNSLETESSKESDLKQGEINWTTISPFVLFCLTLAKTQKEH